MKLISWFVASSFCFLPKTIQIQIQIQIPPEPIFLSQHLPNIFLISPSTIQTPQGCFQTPKAPYKHNTYSIEMGPAIFTDNHEDYHRYLRSIGRNVCLACCKAIGFANPVVQRKSLFSPEPINEMGNKERAKSQQNQLYASQSQQFQKLDSTKMVAPASSKKITPQQSEVHAAQCDAQSSSRQCELTISIFPSH